jgi:hypothetical protein
MKITTIFALMTEFGTAHIPVIEVGKKYFGYDEKQAKRAAVQNDYPFPVFRAGSNKSPWVVDVADLSAYLDQCREKSHQEFKTVRANYTMQQ